MHKVGIVGVGFVGTAVETGLQSIADIRTYDKYKNTESLESVVENSEIIFLCVPTPMSEDGSCDISIVEEVAIELDEIAEEKKIIVIKSTVPPGTTKRLAEFYPEHNFVFNPEFLTQANYIQDFLDQDRIVLGYTKPDDPSNAKLVDLYRNFTSKQKSPAPFVATTSCVAEMSKYVSNIFLATKVAYFNKIWEICKELRLNFDEIVDIVLLDKRIGNTHCRVPGPDGDFGFGGACFPKDINAIISLAEDLYVDPLILDSVWTKNLYVRKNHEWNKLAQVTGDYDEKDPGDR